MSFDDDNRRRYNDFSGYQGGARNSTSRSPTGDRKSSITNNLMTISTNITSLQKLTNQIGTTRDSPQMRDQLSKLVSDTREIATQTANLLKRWDDSDKDSRLHKSKLMKEYQMLLQQFGDIAKYSAEKERTHPLPKRKEAQYPDVAFGGVYQDPNASIFTPLDQPKQNAMDRDNDFYQRQQQVDFQNLQIDDRNDSIKDLEKSVIEINELFIDVAKLVKESQPMIDSIESNVESSVIATEKGVVELRKASNYQKSSRTKLCVLLLILIIIAAVVGIIIWVTMK
jgi:t-SNARE complex subunit (syntaxin)